MTLWRRGLAALAAACLVLVLAPGTARADGGGSCGQIGDCEVHDPGNPGGGPGGGDGGDGDGGGSDTPKYPSCSAFASGVVVVIGVPKEDLPGVGPNWVEITCEAGDGSLRHLYVSPREAAEQIARLLLARVQLKPIGVGFAPKGSIMAIVGLPVWMWVDDPSDTTWGPVSISAGAVSLTAKVESVVWDMGDGSKVTCGKGTEWKKGMEGKSPTCGYTYKRQGSYKVRATSHWVARWSGYGESGTIPVTLWTERDLEVGELQVIVTHG